MFGSSQNNSYIDKLILEKADEIDSLLAEQRLVQYTKQFQLINKKLQLIKDQSQLSDLLKSSEEIKKKIELDIKQKLLPLTEELKKLQAKYNYLVIEDLKKFTDIKKQIKLINGKTNQEDMRQLEELQRNLEQPNSHIDKLDKEMEEVRNSIKREKNRIYMEDDRSNYYIDYMLIQEALKKSLPKKPGYFGLIEEHNV